MRQGWEGRVRKFQRKRTKRKEEEFGGRWKDGEMGMCGMKHKVEEG